MNANLIQIALEAEEEKQYRQPREDKRQTSAAGDVKEKVKLNAENLPTTGTITWEKTELVAINKIATEQGYQLTLGNKTNIENPIIITDADKHGS